MSQAVLIVDHGSRRAAANEQLDRIAEMVREQLPGLHVETAHLELAEPSIAEGISRLVSRGATDIVVVPYLLAPGRHAEVDIPELARTAVSRHPGTTVHLAGPLGVDPLLAELVVRRAVEAGLAGHASG